MKMILKLMILIISGSTMVSCSATEKSSIQGTPEVKNVILMIGDGMGLADICAAMTVADIPLQLRMQHRHHLLHTSQAGAVMKI
jgi:alkaline phosphatase